ncbi:hypothetical protein [Streptomyces sp. NPDC048411]|uniref:hypothetical protein n=1 Tax=Streptomyces sp. NPDC048411 TaxID=3157206 RepID=UPI003455DE86
MHGRSRRLCTAAALLTALTAGCAGGPASDSPDRQENKDNSTQQAAPGVIADPAELQKELRPLPPGLRSAYDAYWAAWTEANATSDPDNARLRRAAGGDLLALLRDSLARARATGTVQKGTVGHEVRGSVPRNGGQAVVDCTDLDNWLLYDARTGKETQQLRDKPSQLAVITFTLRGRDWVATRGEMGGDC